MREIKFRAWDVEEKCIFSHKDLINESLLLERVSNPQIHHIFMQYTGLKDKNGAEIYEGDVVKADSRGPNSNNGIYLIRYDSTNCCFYGDPQICKQYFGNNCSVIYCEGMCDIRQNIEVIGNIYENPELLEE